MIGDRAERPYGPAWAKWAAPGDQQEDTWLLRFCDRDCGDAIFTGEGAEQEAWEAYNRYAPAYNVYLFRLAALDRPASSQGERERHITNVGNAIALEARRQQVDLQNSEYILARAALSITPASGGE